MIRNDHELEVTQSRIAYFQRIVAQLRFMPSKDNFDAMAGGYLVEIERMSAEVVEYLKQRAVVGTEPRRSSYGLCRNMGPSPSEQDIDEVRQEIFGTFQSREV